MEESRPISLETLTAYAADELALPASDQIKKRLQESPAEAEMVRQFRNLLTTMKRDDSITPPASLVNRVLALFKPHAERPTASSLKELARFVAELVFDSRRQPALAGFRGNSSGYQLAYQSALGTIDLQVTPGQAIRNAWRIRGQVCFKDESESATIALLAADSAQVVSRTETDDHGRFRLAADSGLYDLHVSAQSGTVLVPNLEVK